MTQVPTSLTPKAFRVWKELFKNPNIWMDASSLGQRVDMSGRELISVVCTMNSPYIEREKGTCSSAPRVKLNVTEEEQRDLYRAVMKLYYRIDQDMMDEIRSCITPLGWISSKDISEITGYRCATVAIAISLMDDVRMTKADTIKMYSCDPIY